MRPTTGRRPDDETGIWSAAMLPASELPDEVHIDAQTAAQATRPDRSAAADRDDQGPLAA